MERNDKDGDGKLARFLVLSAATFCALGVAALLGFEFRGDQPKNLIELVVNHSSFLKTGRTTLAAEGTFVTHVHGVPGYAEGIDIVFLPKPFTEVDQADILKNNWKKTKSSPYALIVLCMDKQQKLSQVIMACAIPGTSVSRSVAWKPEDLKKYFSDIKFNGKRLTLKSRGTYAETGTEDLQFSWSLDINQAIVGDIKW